MTDSLNTHSKVAEFKTLYKTTIPNLPIIIPQSSNNYPYTPPIMPELETYGLIELVHDPEIPVALINGLDQFTGTLQDSQLDNAHLARAKQRLEVATDDAGTTTIESEVSVLPYFDKTVATPVRFLCLALGLNVNYGDGPRVYNIIPDHAWNVEGEAIAIFEHKTPCVAEHHFPKIIDLAKDRTKLDLSKYSSNATSILSKLILTSIYKKLDYCAVHSGVSFIFIHIVRDSGTQSVVLALILHSRKDNQALKYQALTVEVATTGNVSSEQDAADSHAVASPPEEYRSSDPQGRSNPTNPPTNSQVLSLSSLTVSEYWEARELSEGELAALLNTMDGISLYWDMIPFTKRVFRPLRRKESSIWNKPLSVEATPRLLVHSPREHHFTPPPSPPMVPFLLCLNSAVGRGAVGSVYKGSFHDLSMPIIVKILPTNRMDHELEIWRRLRGLAGMGVPGLFGAYSIEGEKGKEDTGALLQQYAGTSLHSFDMLNLEQRRVVGHSFCRYISSYNPNHTLGVSYTVLSQKSMKQMLSTEM
ncbi:hypothetical protein FS837_007166 [Tulasnella sp. UAMH 9824]|nr:hypothetical protein FS837_007166 [Tulasnella sp. UAMH 9824]